MCRLMSIMKERRGYTDEFLRSIEIFDHPVLLSTDNLCQELKRIHDSGDLMVFIPDFDMDGIAVGTEALAGFAELGFNIALYIPTPSDGYGFRPLDIEKIRVMYPNVKVIMTGDVGIGCVEAVQYAKDLGIDVLITDHHKENVSNTTRGIANVVVNPMRADETYDHPAICGAYVLYQVLTAYADLYGSVFEQEQVRRLVVFAGIGTISDSMPLLYENRDIVRQAIELCNILYSDGDPYVLNVLPGCDLYRRAFSGIFQTISYLSEAGKVSVNGLSEEFFGYYLAPMFNSVKRMNKDMNHAFGVFFGPNPRDEVDYLFKLNEERKELLAQCLDDVYNSDQPYKESGLYITTAPAGIRGLIAQDIMKHTGYPVFVVAKEGNGYSGSGRSPEWYPALDRCVPMGFYLAGHNPAFGIGFTDKKELKAFATFVKQDIIDVVTELSTDIYSLQAPHYDFVINNDGSGDTPIDIVSFVEFVYECNKLKPFGKGLPKPVILLVINPEDIAEWMTLGSDNQHLKIRMMHSFTVLCWNQAEYISLQNHTEPLMIEGYLDISEYMDSHTVNFIGNVIGYVPSNKGDM